MKFLITPYLNHDEKVGGPAWAEKLGTEKRRQNKAAFLGLNNLFSKHWYLCE